MVVGRFSDNFWGDKINGFDILYQNLKHSLVNVKELETYLRECANIEDQYSKSISKLASRLNSFSTNGTFYPIWSPLKELNERLAGTHLQIMQQIHEIIKETQRYNDDLNRKIRRIRDNESQTQICVQTFQEITQTLNKSKEQYHNLAIELEKQKRAENTNIQKIEKKVKQSYDEYKANVDKYNLIRNEYERKFNDSCTNLQLAEELHLKQIKQLVDNYGKIFVNSNQTIKQLYDECQVKIESLNNDVLIQTFIDNKRTGSERPEPVSVIEPDFSKLPTVTTTSSSTPAPSTTSFNANISTNSGSSGGNNSVNNYNSFADNDFNLFLNPNINMSTTNEKSNSPFSSLINGNSNNSLNGGSVVSSSNISTNTNAHMNGSTANMPLLFNSVSTNAVNNINPSVSSASSSSSNDMKRSDSRGLNIFNIDILSRNKSKDKKAQKSTKTKKKQQQTQSPQVPPQQQTQDLIQINAKDTNSINSDEIIEHRTLNEGQNSVNTSINANSLTTATQRNTNNNNATTNNMHGSSSLDLFDQLKFNSNGGSDVDSEGYSIRPEYKGDKKKDNDDMNNFYDSSSTDNDSDSEPEAGVGPTKVMLKIKPKTEAESKQTENSDVLREVSKNLQLKPLNVLQQQQQQQQQFGSNGALNQQKKRTYYSFGTLANANNQPEQTSSWPSNNTQSNTSITNQNSMSRSVSFGGATLPTPPTIVTPPNDLSFNTNDFSKTQTNQVPTQTTTTKPTTDPNLYNIDEDKEVESSFQSKRNSQLIQNNQLSFSLPLPPNTAPSIPGRFTPACFPGRTTPDFRHTTSLFENSTRGVASPLTINGTEVIPLAVAFNETIHAYFKLNETNKYKLKCSGCMKISFPYAVFKYLATEIPQMEFCLKNLSVTAQDLIINNQLLTQTSDLSQQIQFQFNTTNFTKELRDQHQQNKQAAFFNFELLKYEVKSVTKPPLLLNATWKHRIIDSNNIELEFNLDYTHNYTKQLSNLNFMLVLVQNLNVFKITYIDSKPHALTQETEQKLQILWNLPTLSNSSDSLNAKFNVNILNKDDFRSSNLLDSICTQPLYVKFHMDDDTLSHVKFDILSPNYRLSLLREKIESGKYFCTPSLILHNETLDSIYEQLSSNELVANNNGKTPAAGTISTQIGSSVDILFNY